MPQSKEAGRDAIIAQYAEEEGVSYDDYVSALIDNLDKAAARTYARRKRAAELWAERVAAKINKLAQQQSPQ